MIFIEVRCDKCGSVGLSRRCFYAHVMREELVQLGSQRYYEYADCVSLKVCLCLPF